MALMIPSRPRSLSAGSLEDIMFDSLEKLSDDFFVFHSLRIVSINNDNIYESETDFVIFNRFKGLLCLEAKAGKIRYENGDWFYGSGIKMSHDGPYNQASKNKWNIKNYIQNSKCSNLLSKCKLLHAVWFPSITDSDLTAINLPPEADRRITLTKSTLSDPTKRIEEVFSINVPSQILTCLSEFESKSLIMYVLCPSFDLIPSINMENELKKQVFLKMLVEQKNILHYLTEQKSAVIQGVAGTGKTLIALEKARSHAINGEKVLFLCYNRRLNEFLSKNHCHSNIDFFTIDGFTCKICNSTRSDYTFARNRLEDFYMNDNFPYDHIIIDEGQDFGQENLEENNIIDILFSIVMDRKDNRGSFYIFYDALQLIQGAIIPTFITNADCKLTLYKNCRNTENIATTSMRAIQSNQPKLIDGCIKGSVPKMYYCNNVPHQINQIDEIISKHSESGIEDIVILTCKTEDTSIVSPYISNGKYKNKLSFSTCRKFKGLESDAIILIDVDQLTFTTDAVRIFYVGSSRARLFLSIVCMMTNHQCQSVLDNMGVTTKNKNPKKALSTKINSIYATTVKDTSYQTDV